MGALLETLTHSRLVAAIRQSVLGALLLMSCANPSLGPDRPSEAQLRQPPYAAGARLNIEYGYVPHTHCGVHWTQIDGVWSVADPPLVNRGPLDDPYDSGTLLLESFDSATYSSGDTQIRFTRPATEPARGFCT